MDRKRIRLLAGGLAGLVALIAVGTHLLLPPYLAGRVEQRLEQRGGNIEVELAAVPALRLLAGRGDRIQILGSGLVVDLDDSERDVFERLDRFDEVEIDLRELQAGPFAPDRFILAREGSGRYRIEVEASASARELAPYAGEQLGGVAGLLGAIAGGALPLSSAPLPIRLAGELESDGGEVRMVSGGGSVAGLPAGPLAELITNAILSRLRPLASAGSPRAGTPGRS